MRTNEERIAALHKRAAEIEREEHGRKMQFIQLTLTAACFMVIIALGIFVPDFAETLAPVSGTGNMNASILSENGALGYIVIGIIAFDKCRFTRHLWHFFWFSYIVLFRSIFLYFEL